MGEELLNARDIATRAVHWLTRRAQHSDGGWGFHLRFLETRFTTTAEAVLALATSKTNLPLTSGDIEDSLAAGMNVLCEAIEKAEARRTQADINGLIPSRPYQFAWGVLALEATNVPGHNARIAFCREALMDLAKGRDTHDPWGHNSTYETSVCLLALHHGTSDQRLFAEEVAHSLLDLRLPDDGWPQKLDGKQRNVAATCYAIRALTAAGRLTKHLRDEEKNRLLLDVPTAEVDLEIVSENFKFSHYVPALLICALVHTGAELWQPGVWPAIGNLLKGATKEPEYCFWRDREGEACVFATSHSLIALGEAFGSFDSWRELPRVAAYASDQEDQVRALGRRPDGLEGRLEAAATPNGSAWLLSYRGGTFVLITSIPALLLASLVILGIGAIALLQGYRDAVNWASLLTAIGVVGIGWLRVSYAILVDEEHRKAIRERHRLLGFFWWLIPIVVGLSTLAALGVAVFALLAGA